jgi:hypothetical protein
MVRGKDLAYSLSHTRPSSAVEPSMSVNKNVSVSTPQAQKAEQAAGLPAGTPSRQT